MKALSDRPSGGSPHIDVGTNFRRGRTTNPLRGRRLITHRSHPYLGSGLGLGSICLTVQSKVLSRVFESDKTDSVVSTSLLVLMVSFTTTMSALPAPAQRSTSASTRRVSEKSFKVTLQPS